MSYTKIIRSGTLTEVYEYEKKPIPYEKRKAYRPRKRSSRNLFVTNRDSRNLRRLKKHFERIIFSNLSATDKPALITLTMFEVMPIEQAYIAYTDFIHRLRRVYGKSFSYVAVPEFQKRGAVHFHALFWGLPEKLIDEERNTRNIQRLWLRGFVDCVPTDGSYALARYLSKYMSKAMQDSRLRYQKAYTCSRNIMRPVSFSTDLLDEYADILGVGDKTLVNSRTFDTMWLGKATYKLYKN